MWRACVRTPQSGWVRVFLVFDEPADLAQRRWIEGQYRAAERRVLDRLQRARDAHLVQVRVRGERHEAGVLVLPTEAADADGAVRLENRHGDHLAGDASFALPRLRVGDREERVRVDRLDEAGAEGVGGHPEGADVLEAGHALLDGGVDRPIVDERPAGRIDEGSCGVEMSRAQFGDLADCAGDGVLVAFRTGLGVIDRAQSLCDLSSRSSNVALAASNAACEIIPLVRLSNPAGASEGPPWPCTTSDADTR